MLPDCYLDTFQPSETVRGRCTAYREIAGGRTDVLRLVRVWGIPANSVFSHYTLVTFGLQVVAHISVHVHLNISPIFIYIFILLK